MSSPTVNIVFAHVLISVCPLESNKDHTENHLQVISIANYTANSNTSICVPVTSSTRPALRGH